MEKKFPENQGIAEAVKKFFINGVHNEQDMIACMGTKLNGMASRMHYVKKLLRDLREKHGMDVKRNKNHGRKHKAKPKQMALNFKKPVELFHPPMGEGKTAIFNMPRSLEIADTMRKHEESHDLAKAMREHDMDKLIADWGDEQADVTAEYVKLDDDYKELQGKYDDLFDNVAELKREIVRLQVIITYLEGKK
jgi:hypothetical protein